VNDDSIIDYEIYSRLLVNEGWYMVVVDRTMTIPNWEEVLDWVKKNTKGDYINLHSKYLFKLKTDANWFYLNWGGTIEI
jgi:hypothetical protein